MEKKRQRKHLATTEEDDEQQQQQEEQQLHEVQQEEPKQQQQRKRQKGDKKIRQQEARRLNDATLAERQISALQQTLNVHINGQGEDQEAPELQTVIPEQQDTDDESQEAQIHRKAKPDKQKNTQSLAAFSSTIASLLADEAAVGSAAVLSKDAKVFENIKNRQAEEKLRREIIAERRHKRGLAHRQPSEDDPEVEANLKRLATKGTVRFLNVLMAARRREASDEPHKRKTKKPKRFVRRTSDKTKLLALKK